MNELMNEQMDGWMDEYLRVTLDKDDGVKND